MVLDSSALLAVLLGETGSDRVVAILPGAAMSAANLAEVLTKVEQRGLDSEAAYGHVLALGVQIIAVEPLHARLAAKISRAPRSLNLSLGDRLCIALAIALGSEVLTSDRAMAQFRAGTNVHLFR